MLTINGRPHQVVGVMPPDFRFDSESEFEIVLPLKIDRASPALGFRLLGVARLKPGVTLEQANIDVVQVLNVWLDITRTRPEVRARWAPALVFLKEDIVGDIRRTLWALLGAIGIVLLLACANIANLLLVRGDARRQEFAVRAALGAKWTRIARQLLLDREPDTGSVGCRGGSGPRSCRPARAEGARARERAASCPKSPSTRRFSFSLSRSLWRQESCSR